jgi:hypothetical protein
MTLLQRAKQIWPGLNSQELNLALWTCTTFPTGDEATILADLETAYNQSGGDLWIALHKADLVVSAKIGL